MIRFLFVVILTIAVSACGSSSDSQGSKKGGKPPNKKGLSKAECDELKIRSGTRRGPRVKLPEECKDEVIINVEAQEVVLGDAVSVFKSTTILEADEESEVTTKSSGIVLQINSEVGEYVEEGDVLAVLESDQQKLRLESAEATYQKSLHNYERAKILLAKGLSNKESVDNLKFETQSLKTNLEQAKLELEYTKVRAPISGVITERHVKKGNLIPMNFAAYKIVNFDSIQSVINVPEDKWNVFKENLDVEFDFSSISHKVMGKILRIDPVVNSNTGTFRVVIELNDIEKAQSIGLRPGLFGKTNIILDKHENTMLISKNAVIREDELAYTYVINEGNTVKKHNLELGYEMDDQLEVLEGVSAGDRVVTTGKNNVSSDSKVEVVEYND
jgi:membrane fusion protein (multidrug efflux system)